MELKSKYQIEYKEIKRGYSTQHLYIVDGVEYPSVSSILGILDDGKSGGLMGWAKKVAIENMAQALKQKLNESITITEEIINWLSQEAKKEPERLRDEACDVGSQCHNAIDDMIKGIKDYERHLIDDRAKKAFENFISWFKSNNYEFISGDIPVVSVKYGFGGRLDALAKQDKNIILLDWKTSNSIKTSYAYQVGGYAIALQETYDIKPKRAFVVRFSKDTEEVEEKEVNLKEAIQNFKYLIKLYYANKKELFK